MSLIMNKLFIKNKLESSTHADDFPCGVGKTMIRLLMPRPQQHNRSKV